MVAASPVRDGIAERRLGRADASLTVLGLGGAALGGLFRHVTDDEAGRTIDAAWDAGVRYFDTSPWYGRGRSEVRLGRGLSGRPRDAFILSTKVGRLLREPASPGSFDPDPWVGGLPLDVEFDYTHDGIMRSHDESLERLGMDRVDLLLIHDLDSIYHDRQQLAAHSRALRTSGWKALMDLRAAGVAKGIGAGVNDRGTISRLLDALDLEFVMVAMPYTLLDQDLLEDELPLCERRGVAVIVGSPFASGILATGPRAGARYAYRDVDARTITRVRAIEAICARWGTSLAAAALQFPLAHPSVVSVVPGSSRPSTFARIAAAFSESIPPGLWHDLKAKGLIREDAPVPGPRSPKAGQEDLARSDARGGSR